MKIKFKKLPWYLILILVFLPVLVIRGQIFELAGKFAYIAFLTGFLIWAIMYAVLNIKWNSVSMIKIFIEILDVFFHIALIFAIYNIFTIREREILIDAINSFYSCLGGLMSFRILNLINKE